VNFGVKSLRELVGEEAERRARLAREQKRQDEGAAPPKRLKISMGESGVAATATTAAAVGGSAVEQQSVKVEGGDDGDENLLLDVEVGDASAAALYHTATSAAPVAEQQPKAVAAAAETDLVDDIVDGTVVPALDDEDDFEVLV